MQLFDARIICLIKFNVTTTYIIFFQNKFTHVIVLCIYCMVDMILLMYYRISHLFEFSSHVLDSANDNIITNKIGSTYQFSTYALD